MCAQKRPPQFLPRFLSQTNSAAIFTVEVVLCCQQQVFKCYGVWPRFSKSCECGFDQRTGSFEFSFPGAPKDFRDKRSQVGVCRDGSNISSESQLIQTPGLQ